LKAVAILLVMSLAVLGPRAGACPRPLTAMHCCPGEAEADEAPKLERACCCVEAPDDKPVRPADLAGVRPGHDGADELARPADSVELAHPVVRDHLPPPRPVSRPPPSLLEAGTSLRC
jgi:hypothetical protein